MAVDLASALSSGLSDFKIKVLLVDDQAIVGEQVKRMLAPEEDIEFHFCQDPSKALQTAVEISPTVILQDLVMPEIEGLTLVKFYRNHPKLKDIPVIVLSSKEEATTKAESFATGSNDYLVKLPDRIELVARIRYHSKGYINLLQRNEAFAALQASQKALAQELAQAGEYCVSILPEPLNTDLIKTFWRFIPSIQLGGDMFGYHFIDDEHFAFYLLDVCGHGVGSALLAVSAINFLKAQKTSSIDFRNPVEVLSGLNNTFQMADNNQLFFTMWYGVFNINTRKLNYASAGHPPAFLIKKDGNTEQLSNDNFIIGGMPSFPFTSSTIQLDESSTIYVYSDGCYEIRKRNEEMWQIQEFFDFIKQNSNQANTEIDDLYKFVKELQGTEILDDDFSMMKICFE